MEKKLNKDNNKVTQKAAKGKEKTPEAVTRFDRLKREFERAYNDGGASECYEGIYPLAQAIAASVVNKVNDPQAHTAPEAASVSNSGFNPVIRGLKRDVYADIALLDNTRRNNDEATTIAYDKTTGAVSTLCIDPEAEKIALKLAEKTLGGGVDLVNEAVCALLAQAEKFAPLGGAWLDKKVTVKRLAKRVYVSLDTPPVYREVETTPIVEVYKAVRRLIGNSGAVCLDPHNTYTYLADEVVNDEGEGEMIYRRVGKCRDIGGYDSMDNYTASEASVKRVDEAIRKLSLSSAQADVLHLRMRGLSLEQIAELRRYSKSTAHTHLLRVRAKAVALGYKPVLDRPAPEAVELPPEGEYMHRTRTARPAPWKITIKPRRGDDGECVRDEGGRLIYEYIFS